MTVVLSGPYSYYGIDFSDYYLDEYCAHTTHNSYSQGLWIRSQSKSMDTQLQDGVRGFMLDTYFRDYTAPKIRLCHGDHGDCRPSYINLASTLQKFVNHLKNTQSKCNEDPIIAVIIEDAVVDKAKYLNAFQRVPNLAEYVFNPFSMEWNDIRLENHWPKIKDICRTKQRLLLFTSRGPTDLYYNVSGTNDVYMMYQWAFTVENKYNIGNTIGEHNKLECDARDESGAVSIPRIEDSPYSMSDGFNWKPLFVMNHFHESAEEIHSKFDNSFDQLWKRYENHCHGASDGKIPNFLSLDFYNRNRKDAQNFLVFMMEKSGLILFEGNYNDGRQDALCYVPTTRDIKYDLKSDHLGCDNDEARSMVLSNITSGTVIVAADNPDGLASDGGEDDWTIIYVKRDIGSYFDGFHHVISSFELSHNSVNGDYYEDDDILAMFYRNNGLDGKVSNIQIKKGVDIESPAFYEDGLAKIILYEGNDGRENIVCTINIDYVNRNNDEINFKKDSIGCDNDETRSMKITKALNGTKITLWDNPDGKTNDDWVEIEIIANINRSITIGSYERNVNDNPLYKVTYHRDNGLDGKVSRIKIEPPQRGNFCSTKVISVICDIIKLHRHRTSSSIINIKCNCSNIFC